MKFRIGIDARMIRHSGIGTYLRGLLDGFAELHIPQKEIYPVSFDAKIYSIAEQFQYPSKVKNCALWHAPHYNVPLVTGKTKLVVTIHDLIHWIFRKDFFTPLQAAYAGLMLGHAVHRSNAIIAVSNTTKNDLVRCFKADPKKITVIYEGISPDCRRIEDSVRIRAVREKYGLPESFFLYVGNLKPHKNIHWLLRVFREAKKNNQVAAGLVIVGKKDASYRPAFRELAELKTEAPVHYIPYAEGNDLVTLYNAALALVHPSLYEGFGLTLLEAMACGLPVIASRAASIPEIAVDAACLFDLGKPEELLRILQRVETDAKLRADLIQKGYARAAQFSWRKTAEQTRNVYEQVLNGKI